jgi:hypothetical protein
MVLGQFLKLMVGTTVGSFAVDSCNIWGFILFTKVNVMAVHGVVQLALFIRWLM